MIGDFRFEDGGVEIGKEAVEMEEGDPNCYDSAAMEAFWSTLKRHAMGRVPRGPRTECGVSSWSISKAITTGAGSKALSEERPAKLRRARAYAEIGA